MIKGCALASGSSGNCFYIETGSGFLIDAGISCRQIEERLGAIGKDAGELKGIFITHEHADHVKGTDVLSRKHSIPVYINEETFLHSSFKSEELINLIKNNETVKFNGTSVTAFPKSHSASDPVGYSVTKDNKKATVLTDLGYPCKSIANNIRDSNLLFLETNHDIQMLNNGPYPPFLKKWILSDNGHLSNYQASLLLLELHPSKLKKLVLSHLSENNNTETIALKTVKSILQHRKDFKKLNISVSGRYEATELSTI